MFVYFFSSASSADALFPASSSPGAAARKKFVGILSQPCTLTLWPPGLFQLPLRSSQNRCLLLLISSVISAPLLIHTRTPQLPTLLGSTVLHN